jgi:hypothetical protein
MKKILFLLLCLPAFAGIAQSCTGYYFLQNNKTIERTLYTSSGKENGKQISVISGVTTSGTGVTALISSEMFNKKEKSIAKGTNSIRCDAGVLMVDIKMSMSPEQQKQTAAAKSDNVYIEYPANMKEGDALKDASIVIQMNNNGADQTLEMNIINRKVIGKETITSTAGTWDCFKITFKTKLMIKTMGIGVPITMEGTEWFCPGFGAVKSESRYGMSLITSIK